mgnify:CR=1 FL=1
MSMRDQTLCRYHRSVQLLVLLLTRISSCLIAYVFVEFVYFVFVPDYVDFVDFVEFVAIAVMWK